MAVTLAECESMVAAAERNGKHLMIGHNMRFDPVHRKAKELLDGGIIGDIITFRATMGNAGPGKLPVQELLNGQVRKAQLVCQMGGDLPCRIPRHSRKFLFSLWIWPAQSKLMPPT